MALPCSAGVGLIFSPVHSQSLIIHLASSEINRVMLDSTRSATWVNTRQLVVSSEPTFVCTYVQRHVGGTAMGGFGGVVGVGDCDWNACPEIMSEVWRGHLYVWHAHWNATHHRWPPHRTVLCFGFHPTCVNTSLDWLLCAHYREPFWALSRTGRKKFGARVRACVFLDIDEYIGPQSV